MINLLFILIVAIVLCFAFVCFYGAPFVPTRKKWAEKALEMVKLGKDDLVVDLGSGSGTILKMLSKKGVRSIGYEINPLLWILSKARFMFVRCTNVKLANFWAQNLPNDATVVYVFAVARDAKRLEEYFETQSRKRQFSVITFGFRLPSKKNIKQTDGAFLYKF